MEAREFIVCAAVWFKDGKPHNDQPENIESGFVIAGRRHNNCYATLSALLNKEESEAMMELSTEQSCRGFITSLDRYVDRFEAFQIAKANNQIQYGLEASDMEKDSQLISENLY